MILRSTTKTAPTLPRRHVERVATSSAIWRNHSSRLGRSVILWRHRSASAHRSSSSQPFPCSQVNVIPPPQRRLVGPLEDVQGAAVECEGAGDDVVPRLQALLLLQRVDHPLHEP